MHGKPVDVSTIPRATDAGLAYATEDRKTFGLVLIDHIKHNVTLANLEGVASRGVVGRPRSRARTAGQETTRIGRDPGRRRCSERGGCNAEAEPSATPKAEP